MKYALALDTLRGEDSTGLFTINQKGKVKVRHSLQSGDKWVMGQAFKDTSLEVSVAVGHNRAATRGSVNIQNAHPFTFGDVTLVHNGTLTDKGESLDSFDDKLAVDSMQIALALSEVPPTDAGKVLSKVYGSFALVWYDKRDKSINMARNAGRPLHACWNAQRDIMWFMSDADHLRAINKSLRSSPAQGGEIHQIASMNVVKFILGGELKPKVSRFTQYTPPAKPRAETKDWNVYGHGTGNRTRDKWRAAVSRYKGVDKDSSELRVDVNGKRRKVPLGQAAALKEEYDIDPSMYCRFDVDTIMAPAGQPRRQIVIGEIVHPLPQWEGTPWPAVIYDVPQVQAQAYKDVSWLVHPVGYAKVLTPENHDVPHILCTLVHCDWKGWNKEKIEAEKAGRAYNAALRQQEKEDTSHVDLMVPGPEGQHIRQSVLKKMLINGCMQCSGTIDEDEVTECITVNEGRDLMCVGCKAAYDLDNDWEQHMRAQAAGMVH